MKKIIKLMMFVSAISLFFTGCGNKAGGENAGKLNEITSKSKVIKLMAGDYYMKYSTTMEGKEVVIESTKKGEKSASKTEMSGEIARTIVDSEYIYTVVDSQKMITKSKINDTKTEDSKFDMSEGFDIDEEDIFTTGEETINGTKYYFEDFDGSRFYFKGDSLKLIKAEDMTLNVVECENSAKDSLFDIPKDYKEMPNLVGDGMNIAGDVLSGLGDMASDAGDFMKGEATDYTENIPSEYLKYLN